MIKLIPFKVDIHSDLLFQWRQQPDVARFMYSQKSITLKSHLNWADKIMNDSSHVQWVIEYRSHPVGAASLSGIDRENLRANFGMYIAEPGARLMGAGAAAEFLALDEAFLKLKLHKVSGEVFATNEAPIRMHLWM
jgi:UDP-4-amino-4,6-dideoxy-N-acetyl-beta-L-altrosamine N-acetyltransferase